MEALPIVFLYTIEVAQRLDIKYLSIDSLCIIWITKEDWDDEAFNMSEVYQHSHCMISTGNPDAGFSGLFGDKNLRFDVEFPFTRENGQTRMAHAVTQASS